MSILDLMVDLRAAKTPAEEDAARARFEQRKRATPTMGELATNLLRDCVTPDGKPMLAADEYVELDGRELVKKKLN